MARLKFKDPTLGWLPMCDDWIGRVEYRDPGDGLFYPVCKPRSYADTGVLSGTYADVPATAYNTIGTPIPRWRNPATSTWESLCCPSPAGEPWLVAVRVWNSFPGEAVTVAMPGNVAPGDLAVYLPSSSPPLLPAGSTEWTQVDMTYPLLCARVAGEAGWTWTNGATYLRGGLVMWLRDVGAGRLPTPIGSNNPYFEGWGSLTPLSYGNPWPAPRPAFTPPADYKCFLAGLILHEDAAHEYGGQPTVVPALPAGWANHPAAGHRGAAGFAAGYSGGLTPTSAASFTLTWPVHEGTVFAFHFPFAIRSGP